MSFEKEFNKRLEEALEENFPKGKCKDRGAALVMFANAVAILKELCDDDSPFTITDEFDLE